MEYSVDQSRYPLVAAAGACQPGWFVDVFSQHCVSEGCWEQAGIQLVSPLLARRRILPAVRLREHPLPASRHGRIGVVPSESMGLLYPAMALSQILVLDLRIGSAVRGAVGRGHPRHAIKIPRVNSPCLAIRFAMVWIVSGAWERHLALLLCADHWP